MTSVSGDNGCVMDCLFGELNANIIRFPDSVFNPTISPVEVRVAYFISPLSIIWVILEQIKLRRIQCGASVGTCQLVRLFLVEVLLVQVYVGLGKVFQVHMIHMSF